MKSCTKQREPELAIGWPLSKVEHCLNSGDKDALVIFIKRRYAERFFRPIKALRTSRNQKRGYGFAIMALCSLLIESLQSHRYGLPTTNKGEFKKLASFKPPAEYDVPLQEQKNGNQVFADFFSYPAHQHLFSGVDGGIFYMAIRNGLLHQAQTKGGWKIRSGQVPLWNQQDKVLNRDRFADALARAFDYYLQELGRSNWHDPLWFCARRKLWWLIELSR